MLDTFIIFCSIINIALFIYNHRRMKELTARENDLLAEINRFDKMVNDLKAQMEKDGQ